MLQRIQSIYLFLAGLAIFALYLFPLVHNVYVDSTPTSIMVTGSYTDAGGQQQMQTHFVALSAVTAIVGLIPIVIIFLFRNRKQQIAFCWSALLVVIGYSFWIAQVAKSITGPVTLQFNNFGIGMLLCPLSIIFLIGAVRSIQRDEKLVKSADRLR
jgi:predicted permease